MAKIIDLISDIELRLSGGKVSDDFQIDRRQILFWLDNARNALMDDLIKTMGSSAISNFLTVLECQEIKQIEKPCGTTCNVYDYIIDIPTLPIEMGATDSGMYRVETQAGRVIKRIEVGEKERIYSFKFSKPSNKNIYYYRIGTRLYILGGSDGFKRGGKVNILYAQGSTLDLPLESEYPIHSSLVELALQSAEEIGRRELGIPQDDGNDGSHNINQ